MYIICTADDKHNFKIGQSGLRLTEDGQSEFEQHHEKINILHMRKQKRIFAYQ